MPAGNLEEDMTKIVQIVRRSIRRHSQTEEDEHQRLMNEAYKNWTDKVGMDYPEFLTKLNQLERDAVVLGNFNYQVCNGGIYQWLGNRYYKGLASLQGAAKRVNETIHTRNTERFLDSLSEVENFAVEYQNIAEDEFYDDYSLELARFDESYYNFNVDLLKDIEDYFRKLSKPWEESKVKLS